MKFFNVDYHATVIEDVARILRRLGHEVVSHNCSGHSWVFGRQPAPSFGGMTNENYWHFDPEQFRRDHPELEQYDGFIFCYPPGFAEVFQAFKKPTIMVMPIRYEYGYWGDVPRWLKFNAWIRQAMAEKLLWPVANSRFDAEYFKYFTGLEAQYIPSLCDFYGLHYNDAHPKTSEAIIWDARSEAVANHVLANVPGTVYLRRRYPQYRMETIVRHRALVHVPYNASMMSLFEHYAMDIPLFVPTPDHLLHLKACYGAISELSFYQTCHSPNGSLIPAAQSGVPDPNLYTDPNAMRYWMQYYDCYNTAELPYIHQFSSMEELRDQLATCYFSGVSGMMRNWNAIRSQRITEKWYQLLEAIRTRV